MRHEFGSGEWVEYLPVQELKRKHRTRLTRVMRMGLPTTEDGELDRAFIKAQPGGMALANLNYDERQLAALTALTVTAWSYPVPVPQLTDTGDLLHAESMDETDIELADLLAPHLEKLTREPDPKAVTTSSSDGRSKAKAVSPAA